MHEFRFSWIIPFVIALWAGPTLAYELVMFPDARGSDSNIWRKNTFIHPWAKAPVSDWYCDKGRRDDCTKTARGCPPVNNILDRNKVVARKLAPAPGFLAFGDDNPLGCPRDPNEKRFLIE